MSSISPNSEKGECQRPCEKSTRSSEILVKEKRKKHSLYRNRPRIKIEDFVRLLKELPEESFQTQTMAEFLRKNMVDLNSLLPFMFFEKGCYTRNLIYSTDQFELLLICWDVGCATPIHNHEGQNCWVHVYSGQLSFTNYKWLGCDRKTRSVNLKVDSHVPLAAEGSLSVIDEKDTIHCLVNPLTCDQKAISLHIYSRPLSQCAIYDAEKNLCFDEPLLYYSMEGKQV